MDSRLTYRKLLAGVLTDHIAKILQSSEPGHCLRLEGPPYEVLRNVCKDLQGFSNGAKVVLLSNDLRQSYEVSATKLIELRNAAEDSHPLLVLIPSNLRTAAEDSFDRATFKQIPVETFPGKVIEQLHASLPQTAQVVFSRIKWFMKKSTERIFSSDWARYVLACKADDLKDEVWGKNLHHIGLIPDRGLLADEKMMEQRLFQNIAAVDMLQDEKNPLIARINNLQIQAGSIQKPLFEFLSKQPQVEEIRSWGQQIANDMEAAHLDLQNWPFLDLRPPQELEVFVNPLKGKQIVRHPGESIKRIRTKQNRDAKISIGFSTRPSPMQVNTLTHFRIDLMRTVDQGAIETVVTLVKFKKSAGKTATRSKQIILSPREIAEGTYFFRLLALDEAGVVLNQNDAFKDAEIQAAWEQRQNEQEDHTVSDDLVGKRTCDSEDFVFELEDVDEGDESGGDVSLGKRQKTGALFQALFKIRQDYIKAGQGKDLDKIRVEEMIWSDQGKGKGKECTLEVRFNDIRHQYIVPMAASLRDIAHQILKNPDKLGAFRLDLTAGVTTQKTHLRDNQLSLSAPSAFMHARANLFNAILKTVKDDDGNEQGVVESCDFENMGDQVELYLAAYQQWMTDILAQAKEDLNEAVLDQVKKLQLLDHVEMWVQSPTGRRERLLLLTPLHPLKLGWFLQRQQVYLNWEDKSLADAKPEHLWSKEVQNLFMGVFHPTNHPLVVHGANLKSFYYAGELAPGWAAYLPVAILNAFQEDKSLDRSWLNQVQHLLGIPTALRDLVGYSHTGIYRHIRRYIIQHPYVEVLHLNLFNPGDARKLVECIKLLQKEKSFANLRYEIRLFASDERLATAGTAFDDFLNPSRDVSEEADAFSVPSENALFPKIRFSRNRYEDYLQNSEKFSAHLSFMIETMPVTVLLERPSDNPKPSVFCHGLVVRPLHNCQFSEGAVSGWSHFLSINNAVPLSDDDALTGMLTTALDKAQQLAALALAGRWTENRPALSLHLAGIQKTLLSQVHQHSDWVITIDQNMGVDFYDAPGDEDCIPYLLDYSPGNAGEKTPFYITTKPASEILGLFLPHLKRLNLSIDHQSTPIFRFLELLRSVSAVMLMQSISSPNKAMETIGMGLSRMLLERLGVLADQFIIPLDPHLDLFETVKQASEEPLTAQRGDLLLVCCDAPTETIHINVVEVKCRRWIGGEESLNSLMAKMTDQMEQSVWVLQHHFDPNFRELYRLDQTLKDRQFSDLLLFYLERAKRYGLLRESVYEDNRHFLSGLYGGHRLTFYKIGLIFEFEGENEEIIQTQQSDDLVFFHAGYKTVRDLFHAFTASSDEKDTIVKSPLPPDLETLRTVATKYQRLKPVPKPAASLEKQKKPNSPVDSSGKQAHSDGPSAVDVPEASSVEDEAVGAVSNSKASAENVLTEAPLVSSASVSESPIPKKETDAPKAASPPPDYTDLIGEAEASPQYGILATGPGNRKIALDLNGCNTISLFGVPGAGKSYTLGTILEMAIKNFPGISALPSPLAGVIFHFHESEDYPPEFVSMSSPNTNEKEMEILQSVYGSKPDGIEDIVLLTPSDKVEQRRQEYPDLNVAPIAFSSRELSIKDWKFLMGALGNQAMYMQHLNMIMRRGRNDMSLSFIRQAVDASGLSDAQKEYAQNRLELAAQFIDDNASLRSFLKPGRMIIVDLRDEFIEKDQALGLFVVMLNIFASAKQEDGESFNKLIVFDEAHKYITHSDLTSHVVEVIRQMRHQGVTMLMASQDPPSLPNAVIELSSAIILHRFNSPAWLKHIQKSVAALNDLTPTMLASLQPGEAYIWANKATHPDWTKKAIKVKTRPRATMHGGSTQKAIE